VSASEPEHPIFLLPLEDAESVPLRRWLGREAWRREPVVSLGYEPDGDRILFRIVDTPSTASGVVDAVHSLNFGGDLFLGFDGTDACAWPTTIALLGFRLHCDKDTSEARIARRLVGERIWAAALSLRESAGSESEISLSPQDAAGLIGRWSGLVAGPISEAADAVLAEWSADAPAQTQGGPAAGHRAPPGALAAGDPAAATYSDLAAFAAAVGIMSRLPESGPSPVDGGLDAGRQFEEPAATGAGAAMARKSTTSQDEMPRSLPYGLMARLSDIWAARRDGRNNVPRVPRTGPPPGAADKSYGITPYTEIRNRHFLDAAEREHQRMETELADDRRRLAEVRQKVAGADEQAATVRRSREGMPTEPADPLRRNVLEQQVHESLVRARRQRELDAQRLRVLALEQQKLDVADDLRAQEAWLSERIAAREKLRDSKVRQLHQHSLRRCGTYMHHIVRHHPEGSGVVPYLTLALPELPDWVKKPPPDAAQANGQAGGNQANGQGGGQVNGQAGP
jgi:hypothetical protein